MQDALDKGERICRAAELCFQAALYESCISRAYYAMFWTAIAALESDGYPVRQEWSHGGLANTFGKHLVQTRGLYPAAYGRRLSESYKLRVVADYERQPLREKDAKRVLEWAQQFVEKIKEATHD
jgi:uncharacterized protein (UPF0332 family)